MHANADFEVRSFAPVQLSFGLSRTHSAMGCPRNLGQRGPQRTPKRGEKWGRRRGEEGQRGGGKSELVHRARPRTASHLKCGWVGKKKTNHMMMDVVRAHTVCSLTQNGTRHVCSFRSPHLRDPSTLQAVSQQPSALRVKRKRQTHGRPVVPSQPTLNLLCSLRPREQRWY